MPANTVYFAVSSKQGRVWLQRDNCSLTLSSQEIFTHVCCQFFSSSGNPQSDHNLWLIVTTHNLNDFMGKAFCKKTQIKENVIPVRITRGKILTSLATCSATELGISAGGGVCDLSDNPGCCPPSNIVPLLSELRLLWCHPPTG